MSSIYTDLNAYAQRQNGSEMVDESHFYDFRNNIYGGVMPSRFQKMFLGGDGNELVSKAGAVHSSSMLGYNFFHWVEEYPLTIQWEDGQRICYNRVKFEEKMSVLVGTNPANMDIVLSNEKGDILFIESKFLEYVNAKQFKLSATYQKPQKYFDRTYGEKWAQFIAAIEPSRFCDGIKQEICHLIAITNWIEHKRDISGVWYEREGDIRFINLVFEPKTTYKEHEFFTAYNKRYEELHQMLSSQKLIPQELKMKFMTYSDVWPMVKSVVPSVLKDYLQEHYMAFAK